MSIDNTERDNNRTADASKIVDRQPGLRLHAAELMPYKSVDELQAWINEAYYRETHRTIFQTDPRPLEPICFHGDFAKPSPRRPLEKCHPVGTMLVMFDFYGPYHGEPCVVTELRPADHWEYAVWFADGCESLAQHAQLFPLEGKPPEPGHDITANMKHENPALAAKCVAEAAARRRERILADIAAAVV